MDDPLTANLWGLRAQASLPLENLFLLRRTENDCVHTARQRHSVSWAFQLVTKSTVTAPHSGKGCFPRTTVRTRVRIRVRIRLRDQSEDQSGG